MKLLIMIYILNQRGADCLNCTDMQAAGSMAWYRPSTFQRVARSFVQFDDMQDFAHTFNIKIDNLLNIGCAGLLCLLLQY